MTAAAGAWTGTRPCGRTRGRPWQVPDARASVRGSMPEPARERRRRRRPDLRKLMFVLPNLFTVSSIFCGVYSIMLSAGEATADNFFHAFDGRVARMTKTQSEFGVELDSLADVITFGVAPAILVYKWALYELGFLGIAIAGIYAACGAIRLARFNVTARS